MFFIKKKRYSILESGLLQGMTDCHCHILPGVDDGIQTMDEALRALQKMTELGVSEIWLTPHIMEDIPNTPADLRQRFAELYSQLSTLNSQHSTLTPQLSLHLAAEHMLDTLFMQRLADDDLLPYEVQSVKAEANSCVPSVASDLRSSVSLFTLHSSLTPLHRCNFVYVPQGNTLLSGTLRENLQLGSPQATDHQMREALQMACADFVAELPDGLDTRFSEQGGGLSEGQAQRIAIARALLRPGSIMLLDEATSALDVETEKKVLENILSDHRRTVIFVTHRPAVVNYCDQVVTIGQ